MGLQTVMLLFSRCPDRRNRRHLCPILSFHAGGAALPGGFARGDLFARAEAADELLRSQPGRAAW